MITNAFKNEINKKNDKVIQKKDSQVIINAFKNEINKKMEKKSKDTMIWCDNCDTGFENKNDLKNHEKAIHNHDQQDEKDTTINKCEKCGKICPTFESLIEHHIRTEYIQCGMCHKEFETDYDFEDHEEKHRDSPWSDFICETCGDEIPWKDHAHIHSFCHNTPEILEGIRKYKGDIFQLMMEISPEIISDIMNSSPFKKNIDKKSENIGVPTAVKETIKMEERSPQITKQYKTCDKTFKTENDLKIHNKFAQDHKDENFPFQTENSEISSKDETDQSSTDWEAFDKQAKDLGILTLAEQEKGENYYLYPNIKVHRNIYSNKEEIYGKKDKKSPLQDENSEISSKNENCLYPNVKDNQ